MLVEFKISNFRSFKDEVTFSMEPLTQNGTNPNTIDTGLKKIPQLYRTAGIFGANASGKTNVMYAIVMLKNFVYESWKNAIGKKLKHDSYRLDSSFDEKETVVDVSFLANDIIYNYGFKYNNDKFSEEYLYVTDISSSGTGYKKRIFDITKENFGKVSGIKQNWVDDHAPNRLFLSEIINKQCEVSEIKNIYNEIVNKINVITNDFSNELSMNMIQGDKKEDILKFVQKADANLRDMSVKEFDVEKFKKILKEHQSELDEVNKAILHKILSEKSKLLNVLSYHQTENGINREFDFESTASKGTKILFALTAPFIDTFQDGKMLFVDELDASLHPYLVKYIVSLFNNPEINTRGAQLIFTSHAHYLMDGEHLSRDQIWFTSKELNNGFYSDLYSLSDFKKLKRKNISFYEAYMNGIYGAVPFLENIDG